MARSTWFKRTRLFCGVLLLLLCLGGFPQRTVGHAQVVTASNQKAGFSHGSPDSEFWGPSTSGQSSTVGGSLNNYQNSQNSGSSVVGGFITQGVTGSSYSNQQYSQGGSNTQTQSSFSNSANAGSSWYIPASSGSDSW